MSDKACAHYLSHTTDIVLTQFTQSDYPNAPPYLLTFATSAVCTKWWTLVHREYPDSLRPSTQLFVLKSDDMQQILDDPKLAEIRNQWFYTSQDRSNCATPVIPLQAASGQSIASSPPSAIQTASQTPANQAPTNTAMDSLTEKLDRLAAIVESSAEHIHALSVAQSAGLQRMQQINESNSTQIKALAESQAKLQALVDQNASHYIALNNKSFESQEHIKEVLQTAASQIQSLSGTQSQLAQTCKGMMRTMENHNTSITQLESSTSDVHSGSMCSAMANRINPPPRKLNKKIKGVWYEYDNTTEGLSPEPPRRTILSVVTPPRTPSTPRKLSSTK
jgi:hypothetical protein